MIMILGTDDLVMISTTTGEVEGEIVGMTIEVEEVEVVDIVGMEEETIEMTAEEEEGVEVEAMEGEVVEVVGEEVEEEGTEEERECLKDS